MKEEKVRTYMGKPVEEMTREELIDALFHAISIIENEQKELDRRTQFFLSL